MPFKPAKIEFDTVMTVGDMAAVADILERQFGKDAEVRVTCKVEISMTGQRVTAITATPAGA